MAFRQQQRLKSALYVTFGINFLTSCERLTLHAEERKFYSSANSGWLQAPPEKQLFYDKAIHIIYRGGLQPAAGGLRQQQYRQGNLFKG
jgi:hypothetical protein